MLSFFRYNTSLPMDRCPNREIEELRKMIIVDERGSMGGALKENVDHVFDKEMKVMSIRLIPLGLCAEQHTKVPKPNVPVHSGPPNLQNSKTSSAAEQTYLVTFIIPAVVIVCMILLAGIIACVLYRRRRTGITFIFIFSFSNLLRCYLYPYLICSRSFG